jgi:hypothetical protein
MVFAEQVDKRGQCTPMAGGMDEAFQVSLTLIFYFVPDFIPRRQCFIFQARYKRNRRGHAP